MAFPKNKPSCGLLIMAIITLAIVIQASLWLIGLIISSLIPLAIAALIVGGFYFDYYSANKEKPPE